MSEYYKESHDVAVTLYEPSESDAWAEVRAYAYPDGSVKNSLTAEELRKVAKMLEQAADDLEAKNDD